MIYLVDTGNTVDIKKAIDQYPIAGVTTNPTLAAREKRDFKELMLDIRGVIGTKRQLHVQTTAKDAEHIVREAVLLHEMLGDPFFIKIPANPEGIKAARLVREKGVGVTMTAVFTPNQAMLSALAGANYVAPYVNRLDDVTGDGSAVVEQMVETLSVNGLDCGVLAAGFKNSQQVQWANLAGCAALTMVPELYQTLSSHPLTDLAVENFDRNWAAFYGDMGVEDLLK